MRRLVRPDGGRRWLGIGWPTEYGGQGRSALEQFIFFDESMRSGAPVPMLTINTVGPTIMNFGTEEQKAFFLPEVLAGRSIFCIGYSEPQADRPRHAARRVARSTTSRHQRGRRSSRRLAGDADYCWLAARTASQHPRLASTRASPWSIVPINTPGVRVVPMSLIGDHNINYTFWEDVRVPLSNVVGGLNNGWSLITNQLNHERVTLCSPGIIERALGATCGSGPRTPSSPTDGASIRPGVGAQSRWPRCTPSSSSSGSSTGRWLGQATQGRLDVADASSIKVFGTEFYMEPPGSVRGGGPAGYLRRGSPEEVLHGRLEATRAVGILTFGGGTNEIQRDLIAIFGLGMPRSLR